MKRLIQRGLMFGNLIRVDSPALIERYNRALKGLAGKQTKLKEFHIDVSGFSPEIGEEFKDPLYLNPNGCNRQFIILTVDQKKAPLLGAMFSTSRGILRQFIADNEAKLFALTAHDAVAGELMNSVYDISDPARLFDIRKIVIEADTTQSHVKNARELAEKIDHFQTAPNAWYDDDLIAQMIDLARETGDVTKVPVDLGVQEYEQGNFWTAHFGGLYIFRDVESPCVVVSGDKDRMERFPRLPFIDTTEPNRIASFLRKNDLVEPLVSSRGEVGARILRQKMEFILVDAATSAGMELGDMSSRTLRHVAQRMGRDLPQAFHGLAALVRWAEAGGQWPRIDSRHPAYFYTLRARPDHPDRDLINRLLSELAPMDFRQLFICHKELFYASYATWPDEKREFVAEFLHRDYMANKAGARDKLFGGRKESLKVPRTSRKRTREQVIEMVGPWGAVKGRG
ncbi:hypothetical protein SAMN04488030_2101 [Aliiroseovarius halocynthiae]|uniref:Uncharacterized protein n=1 Tax=Aliiroseovarius halocynthiae TaxID=985055 RepID=A0A545SRK7_9RHOB|nr:DUF6638 family protein [Aliiroseovarius halocynthiae]TQV67610.1 hypothetical protein FIL88_10370 [Aliiroseovarius halocynthiae]SMR81631.1 hypothetical protein SAMN04488030_2101 [Aliiroseovarius halocynthiae]